MKVWTFKIQIQLKIAKTSRFNGTINKQFVRDQKLNKFSRNLLIFNNHLSKRQLLSHTKLKLLILTSKYRYLFRLSSVTKNLEGFILSWDTVDRVIINKVWDQNTVIHVINVFRHLIIIVHGLVNVLVRKIRKISGSI